MLSGEIPAELRHTQDRAVLVALYNATDGANRTNNTNWLSNKSLSFWHGVSTGSHTRIVGLRLSANELTRTIPPRIREPVPAPGVRHSQHRVMCDGGFCVAHAAGDNQFPGRRLRPPLRRHHPGEAAAKRFPPRRGT